MPRNEDGEFELVLGNRQLLSVFFIVVVLLGIFFTMGYIVGRNSAPLGGVETAQRTEPKPLVVDSPARSQPAATPVETQSPVQDQAPPAQAQQPPATPPETTPSQPPAPPAAETAKPPETVRSAEQPAPERVQPAGLVVGLTYLQVAAVAKPDADIMVRVLGEKGFKPLSMAVPEKAGMYRVMVGPYKDSAAIAQARDDLDKAGFNGQGAIRKTF